MGKNLFLFAGFIFFLLFLAYGYSKKRKKVFVFGASIIDENTNLGVVSKLRKLIHNEGLTERLEVISAIFNTDKIYDLYLRVDTEIIFNGADVIIIYSGLNDALTKQEESTGTGIAAFKKFFEALIDKLQKEKIKIILCIPILPTEPFSPLMVLNEQVEQYTNVIRKLGETKQLPLVDVRTEMLNHYQTTSPVTRNFVGVNKPADIIGEAIWDVLREVK
ncbi:MAG: family lipolytic protein [Segetibacter sp.]|nr:family lipolytic protein [Segetibacter sp.]